MYAYRTREAMVQTSVQLLQTVCSLLQHRAQEVVRAAITFCKVTPHPHPHPAPAPRTPHPSHPPLTLPTAPALTPHPTPHSP